MVSRLPNLEGKSVAIIAMGNSHFDFTNRCAVAGGRKQVADEIWAINAMAGIIQCDRAIMMDPTSYIEEALEGYDWLKADPGFPIYSSEAVDGREWIIEYPLEEVLNSLQFPYFNTTVAYAIALAIAGGAKTIQLYGCDFTYTDLHSAESGRACCEFWIREALNRGIRVEMAKTTTLLDQYNSRKLYGYKTQPSISIEGGKYKVEKSCE